MVKLKVEWSPLHLYTESNINVHAPDVAGIYRLSCDIRDWRHIFYVGHADNLYQRLRDHLSERESNACIVRHLRAYTCYYRFARVARQEDRNGAERALYDHFNPRCNEIAPPAPPADINFE